MSSAISAQIGLAAPVISFVRLGAMLTSVPVISPAFRAVSAVLATAPAAGLGYLLAFTRAAPRESAASAGRDARTRSNGVRARDVTAEQLPDTRRLLQLGLVFAMAYLVFLICWFWGTRARRGRARGVRL